MIAGHATSVTNHGPCQMAEGCTETSIYRVDRNCAKERTAGGYRCCESHKPPEVVFAPFLGQQEKFFARRERFVFFGGAAGPGKSLCLMMKFGQVLAVEQAKHAFMRKRGKRHQSTAWSIYLRRVGPNMKQVKAWSRQYMPAFDPAAHFVEDEGIWTFPSAGGAAFQFAHMEHEKDRYKFKSSQYITAAFDELTEFTEVQFDYIDTRCRSTDPELQPLVQVLAASNPDGEGLLWVRERFIEVAPPETVVRIETKLGDGRIHASEQVFIPAKLSDNPKLMSDGAYEASLLNKRPEVRDALLSGDWYIVSGAFFASIWDGRIHVVEDHDIPDGAKVFRSGDWGIRTWTSIGWWYQDSEGGLTMFAHLRCQGLTADKVAFEVRKMESRLGYWDDGDANQSKLNFARNPLDSSCFRVEGQTGAPTIAKDFLKCGVRWTQSRKGPGSRYQGAAQIMRRFSTMIPAAFEGATDPTERERPMLRFMRSCHSPIKTIPVLRAAPNDANDVDTKADDHDYDCVMYACLENPLQLPTDDDDWDSEDEDLVPASRNANRLTLGTPIR